MVLPALETDKDIVLTSRVLVWINQELSESNLQHLTSILDESGVLMYAITNSQEEFIEALRTNLYNTYIILGNDKNLKCHVSSSDELREHVFYGKGLITSHYYHFNDQGCCGSEVLGIKYKGKYSQEDLIINLIDSHV